MCACLVVQSCLTLCLLMDYNLPGSSVRGILLARIQEWVAIPFSRRSSWPRDWTWTSCTAGRFSTVWAMKEASRSPILLSYCCSVTRSRLTLCNFMDCSMPVFPVLHYLLELAQTHVHWVSDAIQPSHPLSLPFSSCPESLPASRSFPVSRFFTSSGQSIGASAPASVLPMNIQGWFPLGLTGLISLLSKGTLKSLPAPQFKSISSLALSLYGSTLISIHDCWKNHSFDYMTFILYMWKLRSERKLLASWVYLLGS